MHKKYTSAMPWYLHIAYLFTRERSRNKEERYSIYLLELDVLKCSKVRNNVVEQKPELIGVSFKEHLNVDE